MKSTLWAVISILICPTIFSQDLKRVVCYVNGPSFLDYYDYVNTSRRTPCTHFIYSHAKINIENNSAYLDDSDLRAINLLKTFLYQFQLDPVIMVQIGDAEDSNSYSKITSDVSRRQEFIKSIIDIIKTNALNGTELHWKFPSRKVPPEKLNYVSLAQELNKEILTLMKDNVGPPYQVSMVLPALREQIIPGFNLLFLNSVVDFFNLPAYNFTLADRSPSSYHHAPLSNNPESNITDSSVMSLITLYLRIGLVAQKLVLGVPLFGRLSKGDEILEPEIPTKQVCRMLAEEGWTKAGNSINGPLFKNGDLVLSVETSNSIEEKAKLVKTLRMGGIMFWSYFMDDWNNTCPQNGFPDFQYGKFYPLITLTNMIINPQVNTSASSFAYSPSVLNIASGTEPQNNEANKQDVTTFMPDPYSDNTETPLESNDKNNSDGNIQGFGLSSGDTEGSVQEYRPINEVGSAQAFGSSYSNTSSFALTVPPNSDSSASYQGFAYGGIPSGGYASGSYGTPSGNGEEEAQYYNPGHPNRNHFGAQSNFNPNVYYSLNMFPSTKIVEAAKDIVIEETHIQINDNHIYRKI